MSIIILHQGSGESLGRRRKRKNFSHWTGDDLRYSFDRNTTEMEICEEGTTRGISEVEFEVYKNAKDMMGSSFVGTNFLEGHRVKNVFYTY